MKTPIAEAKLYDSATLEKPLIEKDKTVLPQSGIGMQARKRALRELRCIPAWVVREKAEAKAVEKAREEAEAEALAADEAQAEADAAAAVKAEEDAAAAKAEEEAVAKAKAEAELSS